MIRKRRRKIMGKFKKLCAIVMVIVLAFSVTPDSVFAAKKAKISKTKATIYVGKTIKLKVKNNKKKVKWSTSNKKVAKVSKKGKVKGIKAGKATITAKVGKKAYKCKITVKIKRNKKSNIKKPVIKPAESETTVEPTTKSEQTTTTSEPTTKPEQPTIDEAKLNEKDKNALKDIIENIKSSGVDISDNMGDSDYTWDESGNLVGIDWTDKELKGTLDLSGLDSLKDVNCNNNLLTDIKVSGNAKERSRPQDGSVLQGERRLSPISVPHWGAGRHAPHEYRNGRAEGRLPDRRQRRGAANSGPDRTGAGWPRRGCGHRGP